MHKLTSWKPRIDATRTEADLLAVMRDYCRGWLPSELSGLPEQCQDCAPSSAEELAHLAVDFKRAELMFTGSDEARAALWEMSHTFSYAAERLRVFHHPAALPPRDNA